MDKLELINKVIKSYLPDGTKLVYIDDIIQSINKNELESIDEIVKMYSGR
jgi:hypothetical protein